MIKYQLDTIGNLFDLKSVIVRLNLVDGPHFSPLVNTVVMIVKDDGNRPQRA